MLKFVTHIQISRRLLLAFLLAAVIPGIVISILGLTFTKEQNTRSRAMQIDIQAFKTCTLAATYLPTLNKLLSDAYQEQYGSPDPTLSRQAQAKQLQTTLTQLQHVAALFKATASTYQQNYQLNTSRRMRSVREILFNNAADTYLANQQQATLNQIFHTQWPAYITAQEQAIAALKAKAPRLYVKQLRIQAQSKSTLLENAWNQVTQMTEEMSDHTAQICQARTNPFLVATLIAFLSTIIVVTAIGYVVHLTITRPLHQLTMLTRRIARGDTNARATISGKDEIYLVAQSMNNMLDNIVHLIQETQWQRDTLQAQVEKLVSEVSGVGEGDLRVQAEVTSNTLGVLANSFNYMVEELGSLVVRVKKVSHEVDNSTVAILDRMTQLVETGNRQLQQISEADTEVGRLTISSRQVAERSQILYSVARTARQNAQLGRESVLHAVEGMGHINENVQTTASKVQTLEERSREIDEIVEAISGIAYQTNRLALDAAIQAAMAGENGKGFGAVAADIRRLAERSKDQANMITAIVRNVREEINAVAISMLDTERETATGTRLTQDAGTALESIFAAVEHQAREIENINQVAMQQLQSSTAVAHIMKGISELIRFGSNSTRNASQYMEHLVRLVEQLRASVEAFKLRENQYYAIPNTGALPPLDDEPEKPLTVSGVFRKVNANAQPTHISGMGIPVDTRTPAPETVNHAGQFDTIPSTQQPACQNSQHLEHNGE